MKKFVKPKKGLRVRRPDNGRVLDEAGAWVNWSGYWMRRLAEGSVFEAKPPKKTATQSPKTGKEG